MRLKAMGRKCSALGFLGLSMLIPGCKVSDDAIAASQQMTATAAGLNEYYKALDQSATETIALYELDGMLSGIPFSDNDRQGPETARLEIAKRQDLAASLAGLAASMAELTRADLPSGAADAATRLGNEMISIKALPGGSPIPDALGKAGNALIQAIQQHQEKKAARAMDGTLQAIVQLFASERPAYDSLARVHIREASQVAKDLTSAHAVDPTPMLSPALKPFDLAALPVSKQLQSTLTPLALQRLESRTEQLSHEEENASQAMLDALEEMSVRIHQVATEKPMPIRGNPFSLKLVEEWAESWSASLI